MKRSHNQSEQKQKALSRFMEIHVDLEAMNKKLAEALDNHLEYSPDEINWTHVGTAHHIAEQMEQILHFLNLTDNDNLKYNEAL